MKKKFTPAIIAEMAAEHKTRGALKKASPRAYEVARTLGLLQMFDRERRATVNREFVLEFMEKNPHIKFKSELVKADPSIYQSARKLGMLSELFPARKPRTTKKAA